MNMIKQFSQLVFEKNTHNNNWYAQVNIGMYTMSVGYGPTMYGRGPEHDAYEVAVWETHTDDDVPLTSENDVIGWVDHEEIDSLMHVLATEPMFGECCRMLKRTGYSARFSNIGRFRHRELDPYHDSCI